MTARRILIVDDNELSRKLLNDVLRAEGHIVRDASCGDEALSAIADERPDLVLLDIMMPGMDGFEIVRRLKADMVTCTIPLIIVTALDDEGSCARLATAGIDALISKPINRWELRDLITRILTKPTGSDHE